MNEFKITNVTAREVLSGLFIPALEVTVEVNGSIVESAIAPMGQSTGIDEASEVRDGGGRYDGAGCLTAAKNANTELRELLLGMDVTRQREIDGAMNMLDGTGNKSRLGANAIVAASAAVCKAAAKAAGLPLYRTDLIKILFFIDCDLKRSTSGYLADIAAYNQACEEIQVSYYQIYVPSSDR